MAESDIGNPGVIVSPGMEPGDEQFLLRAFRSFAQAADSLERSYGTLRAEVERLRRELGQSNSDLAQSLEENRSMRAHLDRILEGLPCGVLVVSSAGQISRMNPEALRLLDLGLKEKEEEREDEDEGEGEDGMDALPTSDAVAARAIASTVSGSLLDLSRPVRQLLDRARQASVEQEMNVPDRRGSSRWLAARYALITDATIADGAANSSVYMLRDVSERKSLEEAQAKLRREQALAEMSAVLAHEIRNPLGSLELFAGLLAEAELDGECRQWVEHVQAGLRTLAATVNNVLHFHSLPEPERAPVDLGRLIEWARDFFAPLARQSRIVLSLENHLGDVFFPADRHRLEQVLLNLILNAQRAMPGGGWIQLSGRKIEGGRAVSLAVTDTGPGISPEYLPRLFDAGFSTRAGGPGLGLAVCRKIVEQHGGAIDASCRPGCGATFTCTFPLAAEAAGGWTE